MIIVEGPDGSGKSTTIQLLGYVPRKFKALRAGVGGEDHGNWGGHQRAPVAYAREVLRAKRDPRPIAFDRFHLSEVVYGPILRNTQELPEEDLLKLNEFLREQQVPVILCLPSLARTLENVFQEGRERPAYQTMEFLTRAYAGFERLAPFATIVYDFTRDVLPDLLRPSAADRTPGA